MSISERILLNLSIEPGKKDYCSSCCTTTIDSALDILHRVYPNLGTLVTGKRIVDFGCGNGLESIALVKQYGCTVVGIDTNHATLQNAIQNANSQNIPSHKLSFVDHISPNMLDCFDVVISQNSFEHFGNPEKALNEMISLLNSSGILLLTFGPPWFAPYGSHMNFFCKIPWLNILFSEKTVMNVRRNFRNDGAKRYEEVESGLNKMTVARFERIVSSINLKLEATNYECIKGLNLLSRLPLLRELFINHISVFFRKGA